jgi:hypothetical protein
MLFVARQEKEEPSLHRGEEWVLALECEPPLGPNIRESLNYFILERAFRFNNDQRCGVLDCAD